ncbi:hypothetical protein COCSUDRAFT_63382 [Coccomyxa subellipsoidea C-169]|uniref:Uncharacterized protein n=1 Tax=Coccomyxa subellipsoidea (strain C-169) TaxID=574566 RepID=I0YX74_COCSC|nr:hypothetical protein COCSUDRAFT_63382 [Coccomyxa subellipsoidea C-169]EIE22993.1 hypothetical protein COCSUDRAFT_63382 [Coccomyxa subellipsoidea C-169]|eukprot:XP_005647537.1 hypothetical protein COCSUDRAFT_63382 [Coccomyxa subellipsoidea C-169]
MSMLWRPTGRHAHADFIMAEVTREMRQPKPQEEAVVSLLQSALNLSSAPDKIGQALYRLMAAHMRFKGPSSAAGGLGDMYNFPSLLNPFKNDMPNWQREKVSEGFRLAGDKILQDGAWEQAKLMYSLSLDMNLCNFNALCNRAHINLELKFYKEAAADATAVISARGGGNKAMLDDARRRRSEAYLWLGKTLNACADLNSVRNKSHEDVVRLGLLVATQALDGWKGA